VDDVGAELGIGEGRHIDVRNGAEELHGLSGAPEGTVQDLLGRAESDDRLIGQAHQVDQGLERLGTVLARERTHLLEAWLLPVGLPETPGLNWVARPRALPLQGGAEAGQGDLGQDLEGAGEAMRGRPHHLLDRKRPELHANQVALVLTRAVMRWDEAQRLQAIANENATAEEESIEAQGARNVLWRVGLLGWGVGAPKRPFGGPCQANAIHTKK
jgi:hypothetical protein